MVGDTQSPRRCSPGPDSRPRSVTDICVRSWAPLPELPPWAPRLARTLSLATVVSGCAAQGGGGLGRPRRFVGLGVGLTLSTNVLSFSGISRGMVVRTSMMADRGMLTLGLEAWGARGRGRERVTRGLLKALHPPAPQRLEPPSAESTTAALAQRCSRLQFTDG